MKKLLAIFFAVLMFSALTVSVFASSGTTLDYKLSSDGESEIVKLPGDIITVTYTIENITENAPFNISFFANEIYYDHTMFEYVEGSAKVVIDGLDQSSASLKVYSNDEHRLYFNGLDFSAKEYPSSFAIGSFQLKVITPYAGISTIKSVPERAVVTYKEGYTVKTSDITVMIDGPDAPPLYKLSFVKNGGVGVVDINRYEGTVIDLSEYVPTKDNHEFLGWYSDEGLTTPVTSVTLTSDMTVYAKWKDITPTPPPPGEGDGEEDKTPPEIIVGAGIKSASVNDDGELVLVLTNGNVMNVGKVNHPDGKTDEFIQSVKFGEGRTSLIITFTDGSRTTVEISNPGITAPVEDDGGINWLYILLILLAVFIIFCLFVLVMH